MTNIQVNESAPLNYSLSWQFLRQSIYCNKIFLFEGVKYYAGFHRQIHSLCNELSLQGISIQITEMCWKCRENRIHIDYSSRQKDRIPPYLIKKFSFETAQVCRKCGGELDERIMPKEKTFGKKRAVKMLDCWVCASSEYLMRSERPAPKTFSVENWVEIIAKGKQNK